MQTLLKKLAILADAAKYDVACSASASARNPAMPGVCHAFSADGRCISLLKVLLSNHCLYECAYCSNRASSNTPRARFSPEELAWLTVAFYRRNYISGLFLSSGVFKSPDHTMEQMIQVLHLLRHRYHFRGFIHLKLIPGASEELIEQASLLADRVSSNLELPSSRSLSQLAPQKSREAVLAPMQQIKSMREAHKQAGAMSTQLIVGASPESDRDILTLSERLYDRGLLKRVYYSAYQPVFGAASLPATPAPLLREHRLYQADWLLRFYGFSASEIVPPARTQLDTRFDPKVVWALENLEQFPLEINRADYWQLLRVPGIGVRSARAIIQARRTGALSGENISRLGVAYKRARHFLSARGRYLGDRLEPGAIRRALAIRPLYYQPSLFGAVAS